MTPLFKVNTLLAEGMIGVEANGRAKLGELCRDQIILSRMAGLLSNGDLYCSTFHNIFLERLVNPVGS